MNNIHFVIFIIILLKNNTPYILLFTIIISYVILIIYFIVILLLYKETFIVFNKIEFQINIQLIVLLKTIINFFYIMYKYFLI